MKSLILTLAIMMSVLSCNSQTNDTTSMNIQDSTTVKTPPAEQGAPVVMDVEIPNIDSLLNIITTAKNIEIELPYTITDTITKDSIRKRVETIKVALNKEQLPVAKFLFSNIENFKYNTIIKGKFVPRLSISFFTKDKKECILKFDFSLNKQAIYDKNGKCIAISDINKSEILRFILTVIPKDELCNKLHSDIKL